MSILFSIFTLLFLIAIFAGVVLFITYIARRLGIINTAVDDEGTQRNSLGDLWQQMEKLSDSLIFRFVIIAILVSLMTIPLDMVNDIVRERSQLYSSVIRGIANTWGHQQTVSGPILVVPYTEKHITEKIVVDKEGNQRTIDQTNFLRRTAIVLPDTLNLDSNLNGEQRQRSLYKSLVYRSELSIKGQFTRPDLSSHSSHLEEIHWDQAWLSLGISDTRAINSVSTLQWNESDTDFEPGTRIVNIVKSGFHAPLDLSGDAQTFSYSLSLNIRGSNGFYFKPFGKTTNVGLKSDWPHPSFQGNVLPDEHHIDNNGFTASWSIPHLARNYPQLWTLETQSFDVNEFKAGVNLFESVSLYSQITRAIKYGILFLALTYITFLIFELGIKRRLHIVQYGVIGLALTMFYLTLLSVAEHASFFNAYLLAASIIIVMISLYAYAAIRNIPRTLFIASLLGGLYAILYSLLKLEDYALLVGSILLLGILGILMYLTRNIGTKDTNMTKAG